MSGEREQLTQEGGLGRLRRVGTVLAAAGLSLSGCSLEAINNDTSQEGSKVYAGLVSEVKKSETTEDLKEGTREAAITALGVAFQASPPEVSESVDEVEFRTHHPFDNDGDPSYVVYSLNLPKDGSSDAQIYISYFDDTRSSAGTLNIQTQSAELPENIRKLSVDDVLGLLEGAEKMYGEHRLLASNLAVVSRDSFSVDGDDSKKEVENDKEALVEVLENINPAK